MPRPTSYEHGVPCWTDLGTPDADAAERFYGALFGWTAEPAGPPEETGGYRFFLKDGIPVAGFGPLMQEGQPVVWTTYLAADDADATLAAAREAGGQVAVEPMAIMQQGRMAVLADPTGPVLGIWEAGEFAGAGLVNEPGSLCWNECATPDVDTAKAFYERVFRVRAQTRDVGEMAYTMLHLDSREVPVAGLRALQDGEPPHWATCFAVADCDAALAAADDLGGTTLVAPTDTPQGRFAALADPHGAPFQVIALA